MSACHPHGTRKGATHSQRVRLRDAFAQSTIRLRSPPGALGSRAQSEPRPQHVALRPRCPLPVHPLSHSSSQPTRRIHSSVHSHNHVLTLWHSSHVTYPLHPPLQLPVQKMECPVLSPPPTHTQTPTHATLSRTGQGQDATAELLPVGAHFGHGGKRAVKSNNLAAT
jgi:hypothetical protein